MASAAHQPERCYQQVSEFPFENYDQLADALSVPRAIPINTGNRVAQMNMCDGRRTAHTPGRARKQNRLYKIVFLHLFPL